MSESLNTPPGGGSAESRQERVAVVLAAGKGTRMRSQTPKVLHHAAGRSLLDWALTAARASGCQRILVVVGHESERVEAATAGDDIVWVQQVEQLGPGHALAQVEPHVEDDTTLLILSGDVPLVTSATLERLARAAAAGWGAMAVAELTEPGALGRVVGNDRGQLTRIVEAADANPQELALKRINAGIYALPAPDVFRHLERLGTDNAKGELYLTDALTAAANAGQGVALIDLEDPSEAFGVNDRHDLARVHRALLDRHHDALMRSGVTLLEPARSVIEATVCVDRDTLVHPAVSISGHTRIGRGCVIHQGAWIRDSTIRDGAVIEPYSVLDGADVGPDCTVGPFARLRPASVLLSGARVGNFVELKKTRLGAGSKASHLTYLGDTTVGDGANIGAGVITCNYDGQAKHSTEIGDGAFVGSDTMLIAPVKVGARATTGAGSAITHDVPDEALAVARGRQRTIPGWAGRARRGTPTSSQPEDTQAENTEPEDTKED